VIVVVLVIVTAIAMAIAFVVVIAIAVVTRSHLGSRRYQFSTPQPPPDRSHHGCTVHHLCCPSLFAVRR
jgi:hypothetical protein